MIEVPLPSGKQWVRGGLLACMYSETPLSVNESSPVPMHSCGGYYAVFADISK